MRAKREEIRKWIIGLAEKFRQKGAISPDKSMTAEELDLSTQFKEAMNRRLDGSGIFVEVNGKYYLSEERLKLFEEQAGRANEGFSLQRRIVVLRIIQLVAIVLFAVAILVNIFIQSWELRVITSGLLFAWLIISVIVLFYMIRVRRRHAKQS